MRAKVCSTRALTCLCDRLCSSFQAGSSSPLRRRCGMTSPVPLVAAVGDGHRLADSGLGAGFLPAAGFMPVARQGPADDHDQTGVGVDDHLMSRGVAVVLRLLGDRVVTGGHQGSVDDEHGVLAETLPWLEREQRPEVVDDPVLRRLGDTEQRGDLAHRQVRPPVGRDQQNAVLQRQAPRPPATSVGRALAADRGHQLAEAAWAQPAERGYPGRLRRRDHTSHTMTIPSAGRAGPAVRAVG